jgi:hypothetical protein
MKLYRKQQEKFPARIGMFCDVVKTVVQGENHVAGENEIKPRMTILAHPTNSVNRF